MKRLFILLLCLCALLTGCTQAAPNPAPDPAPRPVPAPTDHHGWETPAAMARFSWGDYVNISLPMPEGWEWEHDDAKVSGEKVSDIPERQGFVFWKSDEPKLQFIFSCWPEGFGMCATGVEFSQVGSRHDLTLAEEQGDGVVAVTILFNDVPGSYLVAGSIPNELWAQYRDTVVELADNATVAEGCMTLDEAVAIAAEKCDWLPDYEDVYGDYNAREGVWCLHFASDPQTDGLDCWVWVTPDGEIAKEAYDAEGNDPLVWNNGNLSPTPKVGENG